MVFGSMLDLEFEEILSRSKVKSAITKTKSGKATGPSCGSRDVEGFWRYRRTVGD